MITKLSILLSLVIATTASISFAAKVIKKQNTAATQVQLLDVKFLPESKIKLDGDSTLKKYSAASGTFLLNAKALSNSEPISGLAWTPKELNMSLEVKSLKSGDNLLDDHMYENLKADKHPNITMKLTSFKFLKNEDKKNNLVIAAGELSVAGISKPIEVSGQMIFDGDKLRIKGKKTVLMTDFEIEPPTMMMGTLKTKNEIEIDFDVICSVNL